jgi:hypothetical protein
MQFYFIFPELKTVGHGNTYNNFESHYITVEEIGCAVTDWLQLPQDRVQRQDFV